MRKRLIGTIFALAIAVASMSLQTVSVGATTVSDSIEAAIKARTQGSSDTVAEEDNNISSGLPEEVFFAPDAELPEGSIMTETLDTSLLPEATPTEESAYNAMIAMKAQYPEGMPWTNDNLYQWRGYNYPGYIIGIGGGCAGFAFILSDAAFGDLPARYVDNPTYEDIRVGDILRVNNDSHSVIVLEKYEDHLVLAEGNYNSSIHWGRIMSKEETMETLTNLTTRYPVDAAPSNPKPADPSGVYDADDVDTDKIVDFVLRLYITCLDRFPDEDGWFDWSYKLAMGETNGAEVAWGFVNSEELRNKNLSDEEYIEILYVALMDRTADPSGMAGWKDALASGFSRKYVFRGFAESNEFTSICKDYGIMRGYVSLSEGRDRNEGATRFVARLYNKALGRGYDVKGMNDWCNSICDGAHSPYYVATEGFFHSREFMNKNLSDEQFVKVLYPTFLGRECDEKGLNDWLNDLKSGKSRDEIIAGFANSKEFRAIMASYGL